ncbi:MAG: trehalose-6-phosphate synthase [Bdellovibrionota bacterium]
MTSDRRLIIASNRLPISVAVDGDSVSVRPSAGGLVTAMEPILSKTAGVWIGWCGLPGNPPAVLSEIATFSSGAGFDLAPVALDAEEITNFYSGFSNAIIWPLFHDLQSLCDFQPAYWHTYQRIADRFAAAIEAVATPADILWVHDYHLMGVGARCKARGLQNPCMFFLHIPFPPADIFLKLPWRKEVMDELLAYDLVGFQSTRDLKNFVDTYNVLYKQNIQYQDGRVTVSIRDKKIVVGSFPIAIDFHEFETQAKTPEIIERAQQVRADAQVEKIILSVDRLDYTKGIPYRIKAYRRLLEKYPELRKRIVLMQVVVPSRSEVDQYQLLKSNIDGLVTEVNGEFGEVGWTPVQHFFRSISREELLSLYLAADICLVTPLKDGMNLVCKEYCVSHYDDGGRLILSEFAGAAEEIGSFAVLVNPYDIDGVADALSAVIHEPVEVQRAEMERLRAQLLKKDVFAWARSFLEAAGISGAAAFLGYEEHETIWSKLWRKVMFE